MRFLRRAALPFSVLLGIGLAIAIPLLLAIETDDSSSKDELVNTVLFAVLAAVGASVLLLGVYAMAQALYSRRRKVPAIIADRVLEAAARESSPWILALGIGSRDGELVIRLPLQDPESIAESDSFLALNAHTKEQLGSVCVIAVDQDSCLCTVSDKMNRHDFWAGLENRMMSDFSAPPGVEFRFVNQVPIDIARTLIRRWGG